MNFLPVWNIWWLRKWKSYYSLWNQFSSEKCWAKLTWKRKKGLARTWQTYKLEGQVAEMLFDDTCLLFRLIFYFTLFVILVESESHFCRGTMSWTMQSNWKPSAHRGIRQKVDFFWKSCFSVTDRLENFWKNRGRFVVHVYFKEIYSIVYILEQKVSVL